VHNSPRQQTEPSLLPSIIQPSEVSSISHNDKVYFILDPQLLPQARRKWTSSKGSITDQGLYVAGSTSSGTSTVMCQPFHNNITYPLFFTTLTHAPRFNPVPDQENVKSGTLKLPGHEKLPIRVEMFGNGAQQLAFEALISMETGKNLAEPDWERFYIFDYYSHQPLPRLEHATKPVLEAGPLKWGFATERNEDFYPAAPSQASENSKKASDSSKIFYLHSLANSTSRKKIYAGLQDKYGWWHYFNEQNNIFEVSILSFTPPTMKAQLEDKYRFGFTDKRAPYDYEVNLDTHEYYEILISDGFKHCTVRGIDDAPTHPPRTSIVRFERDLGAETVCTITGLVLEKNQSHISFDDELTKLPQLAFLKTISFSGSLQADSIILSVHRFSTLPADEFTEEQRKQLFENYANDLLLEFQDKYGNRFTKSIGFIPKNQSRHRNTIIF